MRRCTTCSFLHIATASSYENTFSCSFPYILLRRFNQNPHSLDCNNKDSDHNNAIAYLHLPLKSGTIATILPIERLGYTSPIQASLSTFVYTALLLTGLFIFFRLPLISPLSSRVHFPSPGPSKRSLKVLDRRALFRLLLPLHCK